MKDINKVTITMSYEGNEITRNYDFSKVENIDWNEKVDDIYETLLKTETESDNEDQLHLEALRRDL